MDPSRRRRALEVCDAALIRDPAERAAFVTQACGDDRALREEVEALLASGQTADGFLEASIGAVAAKALEGMAAASLAGLESFATF